MATKLQVTNVVVQNYEEDRQGNRLVNAATTIAINSDLGRMEIVVPVGGAESLDDAIEQAFQHLGKWARHLASAAERGARIG